MNKLRCGILSTADIARKNWRAIRDSGNLVVTAVASRNAARSRKFIDDCQRDAPSEMTPAALGAYEALIASSEVDAVYIPLPTGLRKEWVLRAAAAGKHVLCEKPCGLGLADVREMTDACQKNRVQFMDGVMFMHNPRLRRLRELLDDGKTVGPIRRIMSVFTFAGGETFFDANIRVHAALEPTGCLGDLGWYCIRFALWAMNWQLPREVTGRILSARGNRLSPSATPADFSGELIFADGPSLGFYCSFRAQFQNWSMSAAQTASCAWPILLIRPASTSLRSRSTGPRSGSSVATAPPNTPTAAPRPKTRKCSATSPGRRSPETSTPTGRCGP